MVKKNAVKIFGEDRIRAVWDEKLEKWFFSIVDVVAVLTDSVNPQTYWRVLKKRLKDEGNETVTNCNGLKMLAPDGRMRVTDVADKEQLLRIVQSIPSPKAEPFKSDRHHLPSVGRQNSKRIQKAKRTEKRESPRQYDQRGTCVEYARGTLSHQHHKSQESTDIG